MGTSAKDLTDTQGGVHVLEDIIFIGSRLHIERGIDRMLMARMSSLHEHNFIQTSEKAAYLDCFEMWGHSGSSIQSQLEGWSEVCMMHAVNMNFELGPQNPIIECT